MIKKILLTIGIVLAGLLIYYTVVVIDARIDTPEIVQQVLKSDRIKLELSDFSTEQIEALLKIQDPNFYNHKGVDMSTPGAGITTISQGLVKMYYFGDFKPGIEKIKQVVISRFAFDVQVPKDTILKLFINEVYLGHNKGRIIKGYEDASIEYLSKTFKELTWDEFLSLTAMIRAPSTYHYINCKEANLDRVSKIKKMLSGEYIPKENSDWLYDRE